MENKKEEAKEPAFVRKQKYDLSENCEKIREEMINTDFVNILNCNLKQSRLQEYEIEVNPIEWYIHEKRKLEIDPKADWSSCCLCMCYIYDVSDL